MELHILNACANIKLNALANPQYMNDLLQALNYIVSAIDLMTKTSGANICQVSDVNSRGGHQGVAEEILVVMAEEVEEEMKVIVGRAMEMAEVVEDFSITREIMIVTVKQITRTN